MSIQHIRDRTKARKVAGANQTYPEHRDKKGKPEITASLAATPKPIPLALVPCKHEGNELQKCHTCSGHRPERSTRECDLHDTTCTRAYVSDKVRSCDRCKDYEPEKG